MKIKFTQEHQHASGETLEQKTYQEGETADLPEQEAKELVEMGFAEEVKG